MKLFYAFIIMLSVSLSVFPKNTVKNPSCDYSTNSALEILRVDMTDKETMIVFRAYPLKDSWVKVGHDSHISESGKSAALKYNMISSKGIDAGRVSFNPLEDYREYTLIFPSLSEDTGKINFCDGETFIGGIDLTGKIKRESSVIPAGFQGEWRTDDEYNEWKYAFYDNIAIIDGVFMHYEAVRKKNKALKITLKDGDEKKVLYLKKNKNNLISIRESNKEYRLFTSERKFAFSNKETEIKSHLRNDSTSLKGIIRNYHHDYMGDSIYLNLEDISQNTNTYYTAAVNSDGTFCFSFSLCSTATGILTFENRDINIYMESGETLVLRIDKEIKRKGCDKSFTKPVFMGGSAAVNRDIVNYGNFFHYDQSEFEHDLNALSFEEFRNKYLAIYRGRKTYIDRNLIKKNITGKSETLIRRLIDSEVANLIHSYR